MIRTVILFAKPPRMGLSKTRLAKGMGKVEAARIARFTLARTLREAEDRRWRLEVRTAPDHAINAPHWPRRLNRKPQGGGDLGARLKRSLDAAPAGQVLFIGADAPDVSSHHLAGAFAALCRHDAVFGPASDGGFWLFGLNKTARAVSDPFQSVRWSGPHALGDVAANLPAHSHTAYLDTLIDIDEANDWLDWRSTGKTMR